MKKNKQWGTVQNNEKKELKAETNRLILFEEPITKKQCDIGIRIKGTEQITLKQILEFKSQKIPQTTGVG